MCEKNKMFCVTFLGENTHKDMVRQPHHFLVRQRLLRGEATSPSGEATSPTWWGNVHNGEVASPNRFYDTKQTYKHTLYFFSKTFIFFVCLCFLMFFKYQVKIMKSLAGTAHRSFFWWGCLTTQCWTLNFQIFKISTFQLFKS